MNHAPKDFSNDIQPTKNYRRKRELLTVTPLECPTYAPEDVIKLRKKLQLTQVEFCQILGVSLSILRRWETGKAIPFNSVQRLLVLFDRDESLINNFAVITHNDTKMSTIDEVAK